MIKAALALLVVAALALRKLMQTKTTAAMLPPDPAGRRAAVRAVIIARAADLAPVRDGLFSQSAVETANYTSRAFAATNSLFNRHVGHGGGDWTGRVYMAGVIYPSDAEALKVDPQVRLEHLRVYDSLEQSVDDIVELYHDPLYKDSLAQAYAGDVLKWIAAVTKGDGKQGFVGDPSASKAVSYVAAVTRAYKAGGIA